jgi:hypothetical protein
MSLQNFRRRDPEPFDPDKDPPVSELTPAEQAARAEKKIARDAHLAKMREGKAAKAEKTALEKAAAAEKAVTDQAPPAAVTPKSEPTPPPAVPESPVSDAPHVTTDAPPPPSSSGPDAIPDFFDVAVRDEIPDHLPMPPPPGSENPLASAATVDNGQVSYQTITPDPSQRPTPNPNGPPGPPTSGAPGAPGAKKEEPKRRKITDIAAELDAQNASVARGTVKLLAKAELNIVEAFFDALMDPKELKEWIATQHLDEDEVNAIAIPLAALIKENPGMISQAKLFFGNLALTFIPREVRFVKIYGRMKREMEEEKEAEKAKQAKKPFGT